MLDKYGEFSEEFLMPMLRAAPGKFKKLRFAHRHSWTPTDCVSGLPRGEAAARWTWRNAENSPHFGGAVRLCVDSVADATSKARRRLHRPREGEQMTTAPVARKQRTQFHTVLVFRCPTPVSEQLAEIAADLAMSLSAAIRQLIMEALAARSSSTHLPVDASAL